MGQGSQNELELLRRRAYGPQADIHLDQQAVARLRGLEADTRSTLPPEPRRDREVLSPQPHDVAIDERRDESGPTEAPVAEKARDRGRELLTYLSRIRRSTALIALASVVAVILGVVALTLVQRVQTDPLQVGAEQIARLQIDTSYEIPQFFGNIGPAGSVEAFEEFYGLRTVAVLGTESWFFMGGSGDCISIFPAANMSSDSSSFSGLLLGGCAAGGFPATAQITVAAEGLPEELRSSFPDSAAFQFVLDTENHELVVFLSE